MTAVATTDEIVHHFMLNVHNIEKYNWGTEPASMKGMWNVGDGTYINGVSLTIDGDFWMGYLLEVVDREFSIIRFLAVNLYHGQRDDGTFQHAVTAYPHMCGTFFNRTPKASRIETGQWAVATIHGMAEKFFTRPRETT